MKVLLTFIVMVCCIVSPAVSFETIDGQDVYSLDGDIVDIDTNHNVITVRWLQDEVAVIYDELSIVIDKKTRIIKNGDNLTIDDLGSGDNVTVKYLKRGYDAPLAVRVDVVQ